MLSMRLNALPMHTRGGIGKTDGLRSRGFGPGPKLRRPLPLRCPPPAQARAGDEGRSTSSISDSLSSLESLLDEASEDPFTPVATPATPAASASEDKESAAESSRLNAGGNAGFGGKRQVRTETEEFLDVGMRFAGLAALVKGFQASGLARLNDIRPGQVVVLTKDPPAAESLFLYRAQSYELVSIFYQPPGEFQQRVKVESLSAPPPDRPGQWELWVELFSEEYHSGPVRCRRSEVEFRSVSEEVADSLRIAVPILLFWGTVCLAFVTLANNR